MDQKQSFIRDYLTDKFDFSSLCSSYGISRRTGYNLVNRYEEDPENYYLPRSRRPHSSPSSTDEFLVDQVKFWRNRKEKNKWGARKIRAKLKEIHPDLAIPSTTTIHNILVREGLVEPRKRKRRVVAQRPKFDPSECNELWSIDHKGKFYLGNSKRCSPLTICDSHSRYLFKSKGQYRETWVGVKKELIEVFREYGQPLYLHSDNGGAFASIQSPRGYGSLSYWLIDHGIIPVFSDPGCPTQNGRHERMHRDLKAECCSPPSYDLRTQNRQMNSFRVEYNEVRPHESLNDKTPWSAHYLSDRSYEEKVRPPEYDSDLQVKKVTQSGTVRWKSYEFVSVSRSLRGRFIGIKHEGNRVYSIYYRSECLGSFQEGETVQNGNYYRLRSDDDLPQRWRDSSKRRRK